MSSGQLMLSVNLELVNRVLRIVFSFDPSLIATRNMRNLMPDNYRPMPLPKTFAFIRSKKFEISKKIVATV